jgi:hypothetical protein
MSKVTETECKRATTFGVIEMIQVKDLVKPL